MAKKSISKKKNKNKEHEKNKEEIIIQKQEKEEIEESELEQELEEEDFSDAPISFKRTRFSSPSLDRINNIRSPQLIFDGEIEEEGKKPERELYSGKETKDYRTGTGISDEKPEEYTRPGNTISSSKLEVSQPVSRLRTPETMKSEINAWKQADKTEDYSITGHRLERENKSAMPFGEKRDYELK